MSAEEVAAAFVNHYYTTFQTSPQNLAGLYQQNSTLSFEGNQAVGPLNIVEKFKGLGRVIFDLAKFSKDVQLSTTNSAMLIFVTGKLQLEGQTNPLLFSHLFQLVATGPGQYYVHNEIFRLNYA